MEKPREEQQLENKNKGKPTWRRGLKPEPFKHRQDPEFFAGACKMATQAISEFYAQGRTSMLLEMLSRNSYYMVLYRKGAELYPAVETAMASEVQSLWRAVDAAAAAAPADGGAAFLQELLARWNQHFQAVKMTRDMLAYMDVTFVPTNRKTPIRELGLRLWRDQLTSSDEVRERLTEAVKRRGVEDELVAAAMKMLTELWSGRSGSFLSKGIVFVSLIRRVSERILSKKRKKKRTKNTEGHTTNNQ